MKRMVAEMENLRQENKVLKREGTTGCRRTPSQVKLSMSNYRVLEEHMSAKRKRERCTELCGLMDK